MPVKYQKFTLPFRISLLRAHGEPEPRMPRGLRDRNYECGALVTVINRALTPDVQQRIAWLSGCQNSGENLQEDFLGSTKH
jgi:hypothetical protein